jgi:hypothetical protein
MKANINPTAFICRKYLTAYNYMDTTRRELMIKM